ncbi:MULTISPECIES: malto-oligosyltrehalose trehalohydrolase [unclassified Bosea (in: a-proteobacteria)]|uniref:malto-oligosyltrehalose trehalohydrolase n=1 Tax=unclassified Bosea (in: a-proteobacteria) TaxID=2653178 RepID=UPI000F755D97|nr:MULTISPECIES: malto-oligosyltrehalose trehalohydrolase [unclassified Bosea (in: a-proteobacteria)]AZO82058.1 malto-oligosyltrehalose trehalohydrolase [Bosea sp. Tri-49]RXT24631.1 malto-oligosyltrehalose trehalohydrolase [Bosea sp. Tri-39]RXT42466.1 malto-oligosyltrehalose trehalohydrolase [Bosea sp. Tri-54]
MLDSSDETAARLPATPLRFGAWKDGEVAIFRIWAPAAAGLSIEIDGATPSPMTLLADGWHEYRAELPFGTRYRYRLPNGVFVPDPASRRQESGVHGASVLISPDDYAWRSAGWRGRPWRETILYELHAGLLGGFAGVERELSRLIDLGVTAIELMPIADFPGSRNWGYDGVLQFAPAAAYGTSAELKSLIDRAHELGLSVLLDVVFNHFGPDGCYLHTLSPEFFKAGSQTPWGAGIAFDRPEVRAFYRACALQWLDEFRFDGLRFDAVHAIPSTEFLLELERDIRKALPTERHIHLIVENEDNDADLLVAYDAQWNDDFHHAVHVLLTGETRTYYGSFAPEPVRHLARILASGFAFQGEVTSSRARPRGKPSGHLAPTRFVNCLQNHDQIGNRLFGERLLVLADPNKVKVGAALLLLTPQIPMLFMGEEYGSRTPFYYFTDHNEELAQAVREGRKREFEHEDHGGDLLALDPNAPETFEASRPEAGEDAEEWLSLYRTLLEVRRDAVVPDLGDCRSLGAAPLGAHAVRASWRLGGRTLSLLANFSDGPVQTAPPAGRTIFSLGTVTVQADQATLKGSSFLAMLSD